VTLPLDVAEEARELPGRKAVSGMLDPAERHTERHAAVKAAWDFFAKGTW
jgi:hypothetical protein